MFSIYGCGKINSDRWCFVKYKEQQYLNLYLMLLVMIKEIMGRYGMRKNEDI